MAATLSRCVNCLQAKLSDQSYCSTSSRDRRTAAAQRDWLASRRRQLPEAEVVRRRQRRRRGRAVTRDFAGRWSRRLIRG